jgi:hypothetical protein
MCHVVAKLDGSFSNDGLPPDTYQIFAVARIPEHGQSAWQDPDLSRVAAFSGVDRDVGRGGRQSVRLRLLAR